MADLLDVAIQEATRTPEAGELVRQSRRFEELRASPAWNELRELLKGRREKVTRLLGEKALRGVEARLLHDEGIYARGFLDGMQMLLDRPAEVEERLESMITSSYTRIASELQEAVGEESPYAS